VVQISRSVRSLRSREARGSCLSSFQPIHRGHLAAAPLITPQCLFHPSQFIILSAPFQPRSASLTAETETAPFIDAPAPSSAYCLLPTAFSLPNRGPKMGSAWPAVGADTRVSKVPTEQPDGDEGFWAGRGQKTGFRRRPAGAGFTLLPAGPRTVPGSPPHTPDFRPCPRRK
jgi:hypothetical protein